MGEMVRRDTAWLTSQNLMDYSLLVAVKEGAPVSAPQKPLVRKAPDGTDIALYVSIIDFLQRWTTGKKVAQCIKVMERNKATVPPAVYASRFANHFEKRFRTDTEVAL